MNPSIGLSIVVRLDASIDRARLIDALAGMGIQTRPYFAALHLQPLYRERFGYQTRRLPGDRADRGEHIGAAVFQRVA